MSRFPSDDEPRRPSRVGVWLLAFVAGCAAAPLVLYLATSLGGELAAAILGFCGGIAGMVTGGFIAIGGYDMTIGPDAWNERDPKPHPIPGIAIALFFLPLFGVSLFRF